MALRVLLVGETWLTVATHYKGWDSFTSATFHDGAMFFKEALKANGYQVDHIPSHLVPSSFPTTLGALSTYDVIILSDIGANSFLLHDETWLEGRATPNRLQMLAEYVKKGGGLIMVGGYMSFQGIQGKASYKGTPIEDVLPVEMQPFDDRKECPQGCKAELGPDFSLLKGAPTELPLLLGYNKVNLKSGSYLIYKIQNDPLLALREVGKGRSVAWTSDIGPHWCPEQFLKWEGYPKLWAAIIRWLKE